MYVSLIVTTKPKLKVVHKRERKGNQTHHYSKSLSQRQTSREKTKTKQQKTKEQQNIQKTFNKMALLNSDISVITLSENGLNSPVKRHIEAGWIQKQDLTIWCLQEIHCSFKDT